MLLLKWQSKTIYNAPQNLQQFSNTIVVFGFVDKSVCEKKIKINFPISSKRTHYKLMIKSFQRIFFLLPVKHIINLFPYKRS